MTYLGPFAIPTDEIVIDTMYFSANFPAKVEEASFHRMISKWCHSDVSWEGITRAEFSLAITVGSAIKALHFVETTGSRMERKEALKGIAEIRYLLPESALPIDFDRRLFLNSHLILKGR